MKMNIISKKIALDLVGPSGITEDRLRAAEKRLLAIVKLIKDTNHNGKVDGFELADAINAKRMSESEKWATGCVCSTRADRVIIESLSAWPVDISELKAMIREYSDYTIQKARRGVGHRLTKEALQGQTVSWPTWIYLHLLKLVKTDSKSSRSSSKPVHLLVGKDSLGGSCPR